MSLDQLDRDAARLSDGLLIRPATPADAEASGIILHDAFEASAAAHGFAKDFACRDSAIRLARAMIGDPRIFGVVAERHGRILGSAFLSEGDEIRSVGLLSADERKARMHGRCAACQWFKLCGGGFRTRAAFANGDLWGSDPGCYLSEEEIGAELAAC